MSKKTDTQKGIIDQLPGDLKIVAELIGIENTIVLVEHFGGTYIRVPRCEELLRKIRDQKIRELYDSGECDIRALAIKFKLTDRTVINILSGSNAEVPTPLLDLFSKQSL